MGCCGANPLDEQAVEIFYAVVPAFWGRGIATEMAQALTSYLFEQVMDKTGQVLLAAALAREYGFTDTDGSQPRPLTLEDV